MSMYDGRLVAVNQETDDVEQIAVSWDGDEYLSNGEVLTVASDDHVSTYLAPVSVDGTGNSYAAGLLQVWPAGDDPGFVGALILDLYAVERLIKVLPEVRDRLMAIRADRRG